MESIGRSHGGKVLSATIALVLNNHCRYHASIAPTKDNRAKKTSPPRIQQPESEVNKRTRFARTLGGILWGSCHLKRLE